MLVIVTLQDAPGRVGVKRGLGVKKKEKKRRVRECVDSNQNGPVK